MLFNSCTGPHAGYVHKSTLQKPFPKYPIHPGHDNDFVGDGAYIPEKPKKPKYDHHYHGSGTNYLYGHGHYGHGHYGHGHGHYSHGHGHGHYGHGHGVYRRDTENETESERGFGHHHGYEF